MQAFPFAARIPGRVLAQTGAVLLAAALGTVLPGCATTNTEPWPARVVSVDQMRPLQPIQIKYFHTSDEKSGLLTTVLVVHVDAEGKALRSRVEQPSGLPRLDEAAKVAVLHARFAPYVVDGTAQAVSVVMPFRVPVKKL